MFNRLLADINTREYKKDHLREEPNDFHSLGSADAHREFRSLHILAHSPIWELYAAVPAPPYQLAINGECDTNRVEYDPISEPSTRQTPILLPRYPQQRTNRKLDARERELGAKRAGEGQDLPKYRARLGSTGHG